MQASSLTDTRADTTTAHGCLMLSVLGGLAEFEGELIRPRTGEAHGVILGRKPNSIPAKRSYRSSLPRHSPLH